ncbi:hypothetical protein FACS1894216_02530 [Synergistales bacterium]|nr:hypothetical protein FACS1894216_02530 [Synergistales bacterium]
MSNSIDISATRTMIAAIRDIPPLPTFLKRTFFSGSKTFLTEDVDFDYMKGNHRMAPFVAPKVGGIPMDREGYETKSFTAPRVAPERVITTEDVSKRSMGEAVYSLKTPAERAVEMQAEDLAFLENSIALREEWMCRQLLFNGVIDIKGQTNSGDAVEMRVDYKFTNKEALTGTDLWTNAASNPMDQLVAWRRDIVSKAGISPNVLLMSSDTAMKLVNNAKFKAYYDIDKYNFGTIQPEIREPLLTFYGRVPIIGADLYAYDASYIDPGTKAVTPFVPDGTVLFASTVTPGSIYYGAVTYMDAASNYHTAALPRVPLVLFDQDSATKTLRLTSRPLPMPLNVEGWAVRKVV